MPKKVLIITYYWPPAGGPGVQRWLKFVKYLPEFGIEPVVYCPENPHYPIEDISLLHEISKDIVVLKKPISEPYAIAQLVSKKKTKAISSGVIPEKEKQSLVDRLLLFVRGNLFIPDARKNWIKPSVTFLKDYIQKENIDTIITTGPPHSIHLIGLKLKRSLNLTWFADFRDPWTTIGYHKALKLLPLAAKKHIKLEHEVLNSADTLIVTSQHTKSEFQLKTNKPIEVITNGYDDHHISVPIKHNKFTISHIGSLLSERNPEVLWQAISELVNTNPDFRSNFVLQLIGVVSAAVLNKIKQYNLEDYIKLRGYLEHEDAIKEQLKSHLLLLIEINSEDTIAIIPGKLFEYLHSETPILAVGPKDSDVEGILEAAGSGGYFTYTQKEEIKELIEINYKNFKIGKTTVRKGSIESYSRKNLTERLANLL